MAQQNSTQRDRIYINDSHHEIYKDLITEKKDSPQPFKTMKDLFLFATLVGYRCGERIILEKEIGIFTWAQFSAQEEVPVLRALAIAETGDVDVLANQDELLTIAEEYANGGIVEIQEQVAEMPGNRIANLVGLLQKWLWIDVSPVNRGN